MIEISVRKMKVLTVNKEKVTLIGTGRWNMTCFVYEVYEINIKIFFLCRHFIFGRHLRFE